MLMVMAVWTATLALRAELFMQLTPYVVGLLTGYMGFETWKPSGQ